MTKPNMEDRYDSEVDKRAGNLAKPNTALRDKIMEILGSSINFKGLADDWYIKHTEDADKILKIIQDNQEPKYQVLNDLLEWHEVWSAQHKEPFNWYGAVKAMLVMKEPRKPFNQLEEEKTL